MLISSAVLAFLFSAAVQSQTGKAQSPQAPATQAAPGYVEREVSFTSGDLKIPGTVCFPAGASANQKLPMVVLVQGSGPHDRDETIGPNKPFADLAHGLAAQGIATFRYDKRTVLPAMRQNPPTAEIITLKWEIEDDAVAALGFIRTLRETDPQRVFLLGHSLGAMTVPYIAAQLPASTALRGLIMMASAARPHYAYVDDQIRAILKSQGRNDEQIAAALEQQHQIIGDIEAGKMPPNQMLQGAPVHYMREMIALDPAGELKQQHVPALVLQGGKDVQVFEADFDLLKQVLNSRKVAGDEAKFFPNVNHLFMPVEGESTIASYQVPGHVASEAIETITAWVKARSK